MKRSGRRKYSGRMFTPRSEIMIHLAKVEKKEKSKEILSHLVSAKKKSERTHQGIYRVTGLGKQTIYNSIRWLQVLGDIKEEEGKTWKTGHKIRYYTLTPQGWYMLSKLKPDLAKEAKDQIRRLGVEYEDFVVKFEKKKNESLYSLMKMIGDVIIRKKAPPGWIFNLSIKANKEGRVLYKMRMSTDEFDRELKEFRVSRSSANRTYAKKTQQDTA